MNSSRVDLSSFSLNNYNMHILNSSKCQLQEQCFPLLKTKRFGTFFLYRDHCIKCGKKKFLVREIKASDDGTLELNRDNLLKLIEKNEQRFINIERQSATKKTSVYIKQKENLTNGTRLIEMVVPSIISVENLANIEFMLCFNIMSRKGMSQNTVKQITMKAKYPILR